MRPPLAPARHTRRTGVLPAHPERRRWLLAGAALVLAGSARALRAQTPPAGRPPLEKALDLGTTKRLKILPLVDWNTSGSPLRGEAGVSYLIRTDGSTILFDVGGNLDNSDPSPLMANLASLGLSLANVDTVLVSHLHMDHVGGLRASSQRTLAPSGSPVDLAGKRLIAPTEMSYPGTQLHVATAPFVLAPGVATTGALRNIIALGPVDEQAVAVNVEGRGLVLIVGCGHQGLEPLLARAAQMSAAPLYGVVGGLHYPIPRGRWLRDGVDVQRWASYGTGPGPTVDDVRRDIARLQATGLQWISLSPHDSSDEMIELFREAFGNRYRDLRLGEAQVIGAPR